MMFTSTATAPAADREDPPRVRRPAPAVGPEHHGEPEAAQPDRDVHDEVGDRVGQVRRPRSLATDVSGKQHGRGGHARLGRGGAQADERDAAEAEGGQDHGRQRARERAVREQPDDDAHRGLDPAARDRRLRQPRRGRGVRRGRGSGSPSGGSARSTAALSTAGCRGRGCRGRVGCPPGRRRRALRRRRPARGRPGAVQLIGCRPLRGLPLAPAITRRRRLHQQGHAKSS